MASNRCFFAAGAAAYLVKLTAKHWVNVDCEIWAPTEPCDMDPVHIVGGLFSTVAIVLFGMTAFKWNQAGEKAAGAFSAGLALWMLAEADESWAYYDGKLDSTSYIIAGLAYTLALLAAAKAAMDLKAASSMAGMCFAASFALYFFSKATENWAAYDKAENPTKMDSDGQKAALMLQGLSYLAATGASLKAAMDWKDNMAQAAHAAGWAFLFFAGATGSFAAYDIGFEQQTNTDTKKAGAIFTALWFTISMIAFGLSAFSASSAKDNKTMSFVGALTLWLAIFFIQAWRTYDQGYEAQTDEDVLKTSYVFQGLFSTGAMALFGLAAFLAKEDQAAINWEPSDGKVLPA